MGRRFFLASLGSGGTMWSVLAEPSVTSGLGLWPCRASFSSCSNYPQRSRVAVSSTSVLRYNSDAEQNLSQHTGFCSMKQVMFQATFWSCLLPQPNLTYPDWFHSGDSLSTFQHLLSVVPCKFYLFLPHPFPFFIFLDRGVRLFS